MAYYFAYKGIKNNESLSGTFHKQKKSHSYMV